MQKEQKVPKDWSHAILRLFPIPQKGNLSCCKKWRGIAFLDIVGKLAAKKDYNVLERMSSLRHCGFRKGRDCFDMLFTVTTYTEIH